MADAAQLTRFAGLALASTDGSITHAYHIIVLRFAMFWFRHANSMSTLDFLVARTSLQCLFICVQGTEPWPKAQRQPGQCSWSQHESASLGQLCSSRPTASKRCMCFVWKGESGMEPYGFACFHHSWEIGRFAVLGIFRHPTTLGRHG